MLDQQGASAMGPLQAAQSVTGPNMQLGSGSPDPPADEADKDGGPADEASGQLVSHQVERLHDLVRAPPVPLANNESSSTQSVKESVLRVLVTWREHCCALQLMQVLWIDRKLCMLARHSLHLHY